MRVIAFLLCLLPFIAAGQKNKTFSGLHFDKVIIYDFEGSPEGEGMYIVENGKLSKAIRKQHVLKDEEVKKLKIKLNQNASYGGGTASCFDPHLGFVFFMRDTIVAHVTVCLDCNRLRSSITIREQKQGKQGTGKHAYYTADGMSKTFRRFLNDLLKKYNFSHQIPIGGSCFDN